jgi:hypothetical protein
MVDVPGYAKPAHQYGNSFETSGELDSVEAQELAIWEKDGFTVRSDESAT